MNTEPANETVDQGEQAQQPQVQEAEQVTSQVDTQDADTDDDEDGDSNGEGTSADEGRREKPKRPRWSDVNRANREALEARQREDRLRQELEDLRRQQAAPTQPQKPVEKPTLESCDFDQERFVSELTAWTIEEAAKGREQQEQQRHAQQSAQERQAAFVAKEAEFAAAHPDYEGVAKAPHVPITQAMAEVLLENPDTAPAIAYHLGQNLDECARIAQMSPVAAARAIGAIEARLATASKPAPPPKPVKPAPPVVPTLQAGGAAPKDWQQMTPEEHRQALRDKQANSRR